MIMDGMTGIMQAVSYTHLDVYKRQVAGNSAIDAYATLGGLKKSVYTFGSSVYGYYPSEIANKDLTWEKTSWIDKFV